MKRSTMVALGILIGSGPLLAGAAADANTGATFTDRAGTGRAPFEAPGDEGQTDAR